MKAIRLRKNIGLGDAIQFTSIPENYFRHTGENLIDLEKHPVFDYNPYIVREYKKEDIDGEEIDLWERYCFDETQVTFNGRTTFLSNAEAHSRILGGYPIKLNRPRLYKFENQSFYLRNYIVLHVKGRSHGQMPEYVVKHVVDKYGPLLAYIGEEKDWIYDIKPPMFIKTLPFWDLVKLIACARMFIGVDSGPSWIAQCYPDVITKKVRLIPSIDELRDWVPLECCRLTTHWDDRSAMIYNAGPDDAGFTWSYLKI